MDWIAIWGSESNGKTRHSDGRAGTRKRGRRKGSQIIGDPMRGTILVLLQTGPEGPAANK